MLPLLMLVVVLGAFAFMDDSEESEEVKEVISSGPYQYKFVVPTPQNKYASFVLKKAGFVLVPGTPEYQEAAEAIIEELRKKQEALPPKLRGKVFKKGDVYATRIYLMPFCMAENMAAALSMGAGNCVPVPMDQYGRWMEGNYGGGSTFASGLKFIADKVMPIVVAVFPVAAAYYFPSLVAISYIGGEASLEDVALQAARSQVPVQYQIAFDIAVGVYKGKDVDDAAVSAFLQSNPEYQPYYQQGKIAAEAAGL